MTLASYRHVSQTDVLFPPCSFFSLVIGHFAGTGGVGKAGTGNACEFVISEISTAVWSIASHDGRRTFEHHVNRCVTIQTHPFAWSAAAMCAAVVDICCCKLTPLIHFLSVERSILVQPDAAQLTLVPLVCVFASKHPSLLIFAVKSRVFWRRR